MKYIIVFIDEEQQDIDNFRDYIEEKDTGEEFNVEHMYPLESLAEMTEAILDMHVDAVITDFMLNEYKEDIHYNVPYDGAELVESIRREREGFPCFVLTAFDDEAVVKSEDVNTVYIKGILHGQENETNAKANFLDRVKSQINRYQARIEASEGRLIELLEKKENEGLDAVEEDELLALDSIIEKSLDKKSVVPEVLKRTSESSALLELLRSVDDLRKQVENNE